MMNVVVYGLEYNTVGNTASVTSVEYDFVNNNIIEKHTGTSGEITNTYDASKFIIRLVEP